MKVTIHKLDSTGDTVVDLDLSEADAQKEAQKIIDQAKAEGASVLTGRNPTAPLSRADRLNQLQEHTVIVPRVEGG